MAINVYNQWLGIREEDCPPNQYQLLRLPLFEDDSERIQANYKKLNALVRKYATGQYQNESQDLLNELAKAMLCLTDVERKRSYDESLGRESEPELTAAGSLPMGAQLCERGIITKEQLAEAEQYADRRGLSIRDALVQTKLVDVESATQALAMELGLPYVDLTVMVPDDEVLDQIPRNLARRHSILPLFLDEDCVVVACADDASHELEDELRLRYGVPMRGSIATPRAINEAIAEHYAKGQREQAVSRTSSTPEKKPTNDKEKSAKKKPGQRKKLKSEMTDEDLHERKQIGILIMCFAVMFASLLDYFVVKAVMQWTYSAVTVLIVAPIAVLYVTKFYWK